MLAHAPRVLPPLAVVLADIGNPSTADLAVVLDVDVRTIQRWIADDKMPRSAHVALFCLTRWGRSIVDTCAVNDAELQTVLGQAHALQYGSSLPVEASLAIRDLWTARI